MAMAIRMHRIGGPEVLVAEEVSVGTPGPGELRIRQTAVGLNFIDTYIRSGQYPLRQKLPCILGGEGAGIVIEAGAGAGFTAGDRIVYSGQMGSYCSERVISSERALRIPDGLSERDAAGILNKGLTAEYLIRRAYRVQAGDTILVHAAAGAVGLVVCQWAKHLGATVIGTVGSEEKAALARAHGCAHTILYRSEDFAKRARAITGGKGVAAVYDSVGKDTMMASMDALAPRGYLVCFGESSGPAPPVDPRVLMDKGSIFMTRASLVHYAATTAEYRAAAGALFAVIAAGAVKVRVNQTYPLAEVARAHADIAARRTTGSTVLLP